MKSDPLGPAQIAANHARIARGMMIKMMGRDEGNFEFAWSAYLNEYDPRLHAHIFSPEGLQIERKNERRHQHRHVPCI